MTTENESSPAKKFNVLVIDDDVSIQEYLKKTLLTISEIAKVVTANDGLEGMKKYKNEHFDLVILDIVMKGIDGWGFVDGVSEYSKLNKTRNPLIILVSASINKDILMKAMSLGIKNILVKPFQDDKVKSKIKEFIPQLSNTNHKLKVSQKNLLNKRVYIVDDDISVCDILERALMVKGIYSKKIQNLTDLQTELNTSFPDLIILDLFIGKENGLEFLKLRKKHAIYKHIPVVVSTSATNKEILSTAMKLGADDILNKPFNRTTLINKISKHMSQKSKINIEFPRKIAPDVNLKIPIEIAKICEYGGKFDSGMKSLKSTHDVVFKLSGPFIEKLGKTSVISKCVDSPQYLKTGDYRISFEFEGLNEESLKKLKETLGTK